MAAVQATFLFGFLCAIASRLEYYMAPQYREWHAREYDAGDEHPRAPVTLCFYLGKGESISPSKPQPVMARDAGITAAG